VPITDDAASEVSSNHDYSEVMESELDRSDFDANVYMKQVLETQSLAELLRTYNRILMDIRALDAEKKALVYDNYSKLIAATETIRKMKKNMDPLNPMASTLDPAIASIYEKAEGFKRELKSSMPEWQRKEMEMSEEDRLEIQRSRKIKDTVARILDTPEMVRALVEDGREEDAARLWETTLIVLERWKERGVGGRDVQACIDDGEAAMRGKPASESSWANIKGARKSSS
jgi:hypothetical protein